MGDKLASQPSVRIGVLLLGKAVQFLDVATVDLLGCLHSKYLEACQLPAAIVSKGIECEFHYISEDGAQFMQMTAGIKCAITDSIATVPKLDILVIPGPEPSYVPSPAVQEFIATSLESVSVLLTVCTGILPAAQSGILKGRVATGPRGLLPMLKRTFPETEWQDRRWAQDGKIWTSGGVSNGLDMMSAFMRQTWCKEVVETILDVVDVGSRGQDYPTI